MSEVNMSYISDSVQRALFIFKILSGNELMGLTPGDIAKATKISASNITRGLHNLQHGGLVEPHPFVKGHWRLSVSFLTKTANDLAREMDRGQSAVHDLNRYQRGS